MPGSGFKAERLRVNLRLAINRLKLLEKKKTELAEKARKEIADYLTNRKDERARIRVEHIIREDFLVEAMELLELYCDLLLARFGLIQSMKELDPGLAEAVSSLIWAAPRMLDVPELKVVSKQLCAKYSKEYGVLCRTNQIGTVGTQIISKLSTQAPPRILVERYLIEIAKTYNVPYETDSAVMAEPPHGLEAGPCDVVFTDDINKRGPGKGGGGGGGFTHTPFSYPSTQNPAKTPQGFQAGPSDVGFIDDVIKPGPSRGGGGGGGFPNTPFSHPSTQNQDSINGAAVGTYMAWSPTNFQPPQGRELPKIPDTAAIYEPVEYPTSNTKAPAGPVAAPRTKLKPPQKPAPTSSDAYDNVTLPSVPVTPPSADSNKNFSGPDDMDFEDLARRLEDLKKKT